MKGYTLLSVDWDYFFQVPSNYPQLTDWGHREAPFFINELWTFRAASFYRAGLPLPTVTDEWTTFWSRVQVSKKAKLYVSESHAMACHNAIWSQLAKHSESSTIWSFDAHHDLGYDASAITKVMDGEIEAGNWLLAYTIKFMPAIHIRYPAWKQHAFAVEAEPTGLPEGWPTYNIDRRIVRPQQPETLPVFDDIFICRSGAWTPPWTDNMFFAFVANAPIATVTELQPRGWAMVSRDWHDDDARVLAAQEQRVIDAAVASHHQ